MLNLFLLQYQRFYGVQIIICSLYNIICIYKEPTVINALNHNGNTWWLQTIVTVTGTMREFTCCSLKDWNKTNKNKNQGKEKLTMLMNCNRQRILTYLLKQSCLLQQPLWLLKVDFKHTQKDIYLNILTDKNKIPCNFDTVKWKFD